MSKEKKVKVEFDEAIHGEELAKKIKECSDVLVIIGGYKDQLKEIRQSAIDETGVEGKVFNQLLKLRHDSIRDRFESEKDEVIELYDSIFD